MRRQRRNKMVAISTTIIDGDGIRVDTEYVGLSTPAYQADYGFKCAVFGKFRREAEQAAESGFPNEAQRCYAKMCEQFRRIKTSLDNKDYPQYYTSLINIIEAELSDVQQKITGVAA